MLKIRVVFLEIVNGEAHVHGEEIGQIVVSGDNLAEHFPEVLGHGDLHQPVCGDQRSIDGGDSRHLRAAVEERVLAFARYGAHEHDRGFLLPPDVLRHPRGQFCVWYPDTI
jgi:hypothetical protein